MPTVMEGFASVYRALMTAFACLNAVGIRIVELPMGMHVIAITPVSLMVQVVILAAMGRRVVVNHLSVVRVHQRMTVRTQAHNVFQAEISREISSVAIVIYLIAQKRQIVQPVRPALLSRMTILHACRIVRRAQIVGLATSAYRKVPVCQSARRTAVQTA